MMPSSFDWSHYLRVAFELAEVKAPEPNEEAKLRAAISRAYYAAFNKARLYLIEKEHFRTFQGERDLHGKVQQHFRDNLTSQQHQEVAQRLERLRKWRVRADYNDVYTDIEDDAGDALLVAEKLLKLLDSM